MKNLVLFVVIFVCGAISYPFLQNLFGGKPLLPEQQHVTQTPATITETAAGAKTQETPIDTSGESELSVNESRSVLDGPFSLLDTGGTDTGERVRIIRSPEEVLLQFESFTQTYPEGSHIYFSDDTKATTHLDLGQAEMRNGSLIYGIPLDATLGTYNYILIYDKVLEETVFSAYIK